MCAGRAKFQPAVSTGTHFHASREKPNKGFLISQDLYPKEDTVIMRSAQREI